LDLIRTENKKANVCFMAKSGQRIMVSLYLSHKKHGGGDSTNDKLKACKYTRSH
jgi:hypothetical protein